MEEQHSELLALSTQAAPELLVLLLDFDGPAVQQAAYQALAAAASSDSPGLRRAAAQLVAQAPVQQQVIVYGLSSSAVRQQAAQLLQAAVASPAELQALAPWSPWLACYAAEPEIGAAVSGVLAQLEEDRYCRLDMLSKLTWPQVSLLAVKLSHSLQTCWQGRVATPNASLAAAAVQLPSRLPAQWCPDAAAALSQYSGSSGVGGWNSAWFKLSCPTLPQGQPPGHPLLQLEGETAARLALDPFQGLLDGGSQANFFMTSTSQYVQSFR